MTYANGPGRPWWRQKAVACLAIAATAAAVIAATAVIATVGRAKPAVVPRDEPLAEGVGRSLLYPEEINSIFGVKDIAFVGIYSRLGHDESKVDPAECAAVNFAQSADVWDAVDLVASTEMDLTSRQDADNYHFVLQAVFGLSSPEEAQKMMTKSFEAWKGCLGKVYSATLADQQPVTWTMKDFNSSGDTITGLIQQQGTRHNCQLVRTRLSKYVVDSQACGSDITDQAAKIAARVVDRLKTTSGS